MSQFAEALPKSVLRQNRDAHIVNYKGYDYEFCPSHKKANLWGFVVQHRLVVERHYKHYLKDGHDVHHLDNVKNNNLIANLHICTRTEHMRLHRHEYRQKHLLPLTHEAVSSALRETRNLKKAAALLRCHTQTLRNRFPDLVAPHKRKSPTIIDDPHVIKTVLQCAGDPTMGYREVAASTGIAYMTVVRICKKNEISWTKKSKKGETHSKYRRKKAIQKELKFDGWMNVSASGR